VIRPARRWLIVAALFTVTFAASTLLAAYGVFLPVLADEFAWSRGAVSAALSVNLLLGGLAGFAIGAIADRWGPRIPLVATVGLAGAAFALVSSVGALWQLYLFVGVMGGLGLSSFYLLSAATVMRWFDERRGLAVALVFLGFNLGYISAGPLAAWLIAVAGWRAAYAALGAACGLAAVTAALTVRLPRPGEEPAPAAASHAGERAPASGVTLGQALADPRQWCLSLSWLLMGGLALMISVHVVPFARDQGIGLAEASLALTAYGVGAVTGRVGSGAVCDRIGSRTTLRAGYAVQFLALAALPLTTSRGALLAALVVFGAGFAATDTMITKAIPEVFGVRALGAIMGILALGWRAGAAIGPAVAGFLYDVTGSYGIPFGAAPLAVLASWGLFGLGSRPRHVATSGRPGARS